MLAHQLFRDNELVAASPWGTDLVTPVVATPLLIGAFVWARRGSLRGTLICMGILAYSLYNGAFYLFGAAFNSLFLVYVATVTVSAFALTFGLLSLDADAIADWVQARVPARWIAGYVRVVAVALGGIHSALAVQYVATGTVPGGKLGTWADIPRGRLPLLHRTISQYKYPSVKGRSSRLPRTTSEWSAALLLWIHTFESRR